MLVDSKVHMTQDTISVLGTGCQESLTLLAKDHIEAMYNSFLLLPTATPTPVQTGTKIAFVSLRDGNEKIYVMNADGSGQTNLTNNPDNDSDPSCGH